MEKITLFRIAVAVESDRTPDASATAFAAKHGVTTTQLYAVLRGERQSKRLTRLIDAYIEDALDALRANGEMKRVRASRPLAKAA